MNGKEKKLEFSSADHSGLLNTACKAMTVLTLSKSSSVYLHKKKGATSVNQVLTLLK